MQLAVLKALSELGGVATPRQLAEKIGARELSLNGTISQTIRGLERRGAIRREGGAPRVSIIVSPSTMILTKSAKWSIYNCNWLAIAGDISPDHTITDPPYDEHMHKAAASSVRHNVNRTSAGKSGGRGTDSYTKTVIDFGAIDSYDHVPALIDLTKRWVICFCTVEQTAHYQHASGKCWIRAGAYRRKDPAPMFSGDRPGGAIETVAIMHRPGKKKWNGGGKAAYWEFATEKRDRVHPTQKPIGLMLELIKQFTDEGDTVFDPYCGSATTGVACLRLGRKFIGCEIDPKYYALAVERMRAEESGISFSDARSGQKSLLDI